MLPFFVLPCFSWINVFSDINFACFFKSKLESQEKDEIGNQNYLRKVHQILSLHLTAFKTNKSSVFNKT